MKKVDSGSAAPSMAGGRRVDRVVLLEKVEELGSIGGNGGGTRLTPHGKQVLSRLRDLDTDLQGLLAAMGGDCGRFDRFYRYVQLMRRWNMKTSARNQFLGTVTKATRGAVNSEVRVLARDVSIANSRSIA